MHFFVLNCGLLYFKQTELCLAMNRNPLKAEELDNLEKSTEDPRLEGHKTQFWASELAPHAITNSNVISLVGICMLNKMVYLILTIGNFVYRNECALILPSIYQPDNRFVMTRQSQFS